MRLKILIVLPILFALVLLAQNFLIKPIEAQSKTVSNSFPYQGDTITINLNIPGGTALAPQKADIVLVMDISGSMGDCWFNKSFLLPSQATCDSVGGGPIIISKAKEAMTNFINNVEAFDNATAEDLYRVSIVQYDEHPSISAGGSHTGVVRGLTNDYNDLKNGISGIQAYKSCTSFGAGMTLANNILDGGRAGVPKYMIFASDGGQNVYPVHDQNVNNQIRQFPQGGPLQYARVQGYRVMSVAMGNFAAETPKNYGSFGCLGIAGWGLAGTAYENTPGTDMLKAIADDPDSFYYMEAIGDPNQLPDVYSRFAQRIASVYDFVVYDKLNPAIFESITSFNAAPGCSGDDNYAGQDPAIVGDPNLDFWVHYKHLPNGETACISLTAKIRDDASPINVPVDVDVRHPSCPGFIPADSGCIDILTTDQWVDHLRTTIKIKEKIKPWIQALGGTVGSQNSITNQRDPNAPAIPPPYNADYLTISNLATSNFKSHWLAQNYGNINIYPTPVGGSIYTSLYNKYTSRCSQNLSGSQPEHIDAAAASCNILVYNGAGTFNITSSWKNPVPGRPIDPVTLEYTGRSAIVFVNNASAGMGIHENLLLAKNRGLIFVVRGNVKFFHNAYRVDAFIINDGEFDTGTSRPCPNTPLSQRQLRINGSAISYGKFIFKHNLACPPNFNHNQSNASEILNYDPRYLWLFRDILAEPRLVFKEITP